MCGRECVRHAHAWTEKGGREGGSDRERERGRERKREIKKRIERERREENVTSKERVNQSSKRVKK